MPVKKFENACSTVPYCMKYLTHTFMLCINLLNDGGATHNAMKHVLLI
jgi:hypothetical protein